MSDLRARLRALPSFPADLPTFDPEADPAATPATPSELFVTWLTEAIAAGVQAPHAAVLSTADADGVVTARTLLVKDVVGRSWLLATHGSSPKARALEGNPHAALTFFWAPRGRQVRVSGQVRRLPDAVGAADFAARPEASRAATLIGRQSEPLSSRAELDDAHAVWLDKVRTDPGLVDPDWAVYAVDAERVEFWQAVHAGGAVRWVYALDAGRAGADGEGDAWTAGLVWP
jgi:pyridoxamine 5'-phosphate oxidase